MSEQPTEGQKRVVCTCEPCDCSNEFIAEEWSEVTLCPQCYVHDRIAQYEREQFNEQLTRVKAELAHTTMAAESEAARLDEVQAERDAALADANYWKKQYEIRDGALNLVVASESRLQTELAAANRQADDAVAAERERCAKVAGLYKSPMIAAAIRRPQEGGDA